jgi:hypothetical protein
MLAPYWEPNFALSELAWPHAAHDRGSGVPYSSQNFLLECLHCRLDNS